MPGTTLQLLEKYMVTRQVEGNYAKLKDFSIRWGADLFGVANISSVKKDFAVSNSLLEHFDSAIVLAVRLSAAILQDIDDAPTKLYFHHYRSANMFLDQLTFRISNFIQDLGYKALPIAASQIVDWEKQSAHLSHKKIGYLAGLGWIGRNNLLVNSRFGSQFRIVSVLTDMAIKHDKPQKEDCGNCRLCMIRCPAKAIKEKSARFDHQACFALLKEFQKKRIVDQYICGICVKACKGKGVKNGTLNINAGKKGSKRSS